MIHSGARKTRIDHRDFDLVKSFGLATVPDFPAELNLDGGSSKRKGFFQKGHVGYKNSGNFKKGHISWNTGKKLPPMSEEWRSKIGAANKGRKKPPRTQEHIKNLTAAKLGKSAIWNKGEKSHFWKGGVSAKNRTERENVMVSLEYKKWRRDVFERDNFTCQACGKRGGLLQADHIKSFASFPKLRLELNNGRTLCVPCHKKTESYGMRKSYA